MQKCKISCVELQGFKCYPELTVLSLDNLKSFCAVIGPNGCGKSVIGECVLFALGGATSRQLRALNQADLINKDTSKHNGYAQVTLHISAVGAHGEDCSLAIRRTVARRGKSDTSVRMSGADSWRPITQDALWSLLKPYGINTQALDRVVVSQSRAAVAAVSDPAALVAYLELLLGNEPLAQAVTTAETALDACCTSLTQLEAQQAGLESRHEELAPHVTRWQQYTQQAAQYAVRAHTLANKTCQWLRWALQRAECKVMQARTQHSQAGTGRKQAQKQLKAAEEQHVASSKGLAVKNQDLQVARQHAEEVATAAAKAHASLTTLQREGKALEQQKAALRKQVKTAEAKAEAALQELELQEKLVQLAAARQQRLMQLLQQGKQALQAARAEAAAAASKCTSVTKHGAQKQQQLEAALAIVRNAEMCVAKREQELAACQQQLQECDTAVQKSKALHAAAAQHVQNLQQEADQREQDLVQCQQACEQDCRLAAEVAEAQVQAAEQAHVEAQVQLQLSEAAMKEYTMGAASTAMGISNAHHSYTGRSFGSMDALDSSVLTLWQQSSQGALQGRFYGWLCSVMHLRDASDAAAVNAACSSVCNMRNTLVVSERATALAAIAHVTSKRAGIVTCKVLSELEDRPNPAQHDSAITAAARLGIQIRPVTNLLATVPELESTMEPLIRNMLGSWYLVPDANAAQQLVDASARPSSNAYSPGMPRVNLVTLAGQVFKADGEIIARAARAVDQQQQYSYGRYDITPQVKDMHHAVAMMHGRASGSDAVHAAAGAGSRGNRARGRGSADPNAALGEKEALAEQIRAVEQQLRSAKEAAVQAADAVAAARTQLAEVVHAQRAAHTRAARAAQALHAVQGKLAAAQQQQATAALQLQQQEQQVTQQTKQLQQRLVALQAQVSADQLTQAQAKHQALMPGVDCKAPAADGQCAADSDESSAAVRVMQLQKQQQGLEVQLAEAKQQLAKAKQQHAKLQASSQRAAALVSRLQAEQQHVAEQAKATACKVALLTEQAEEQDSALQAAEAAVRAAEQQVATAIEEDAQTKGQLADMRAAATQAAAEWHTAAAALAAAQREVAGLTAEIQAAQQELAETAAVKTGAEAAAAKLFIAGESTIHMVDTAVADDGVMHAAAATIEASLAATSAGDHTFMKAVSDGTGEGGPMLLDSMLTAGPAQQQQQPVDSGAHSGASAVTKCGGQDKLNRSGHAHVGQVADMKSVPSGNRRQQPRRKRRVVVDDEEMSPQPAATDATVAAPQYGKHSGDGRDASDAVDEVIEQVSEGWLKSERSWVESEKVRLEALHQLVDMAAVQEDVEVTHQLSSIHHMVCKAESQQAALRQQLEDAVEARYARVADSLATINTQLSRVYRFLTGNLGDAYLSYTLERRLLFAQGVTLHVRPDQQRWRAFSWLSGGHQALAALAVSFALQAAVPSPFYFFDEVDCALDSLAASRVADYLARGGCIPDDPISAVPLPSSHKALPAHENDAAQSAVEQDSNTSDAKDQATPAAASSAGTSGKACGKLQPAQYIVVSHRPQLFERADCLIGVYATRPCASHAVVLKAC